ncbi:MAG: GNAT family N-acetyltransferase [Candidatus Limnocylindrales bacterium]
MPVDFRLIDPDETSNWLASLRASFHATWLVEPLAEDVRTLWDYDRVWAATEGDTIVGTARSWATELTVPGGAFLPGTAIAAVSVLPTHRRRGVMRGLMTSDIAAARERGEVVGVLWASQAPIYGRFGFGPATRVATWTVDVGPGVVPGDTRPGALTLTPVSTEARDLVKDLYERWRTRQPGEIRRREFVWDVELGLRVRLRGDDPWSGTLVIHRDAAGEPDGYVRYHLEERWERRQGRGVLHVDELHALTDEAYRDLWRLVCGMEWASSVRAEQRSPHERLPWLVSDGRTAQPESVTDGLWLALIDLPRALEARTYQSDGRLVVGVASADGALERVEVDASTDGATCRPTDAPADVVVPATALAAAFLGDVSLRVATVGGGADEHRPGALALLDRLLRTLDAPWCSTYF